MKKMITFAISIFLVLSGLGAVAINIEKINNLEKINNEFNEVVFSSINVIESDEEFISFSFGDEELYLLNPGQPMIPKILKEFELPFGVTNVNVELIPMDIQEMDISKEIEPVPSPMPKTPVDGFVPFPKKDKSIYDSTEYFPRSWYSYNVGCGLNKNGDHVTHLEINMFPVKYSPLLNKLSIASSAEIKINYDNPDIDIFPASSEYDLVIIAPSSFQSNIQPLIDHKISYGISTILKTTEDIYDEYEGVDKPEQIKYFIKDALETWDMKYVLLIGGLKSNIQLTFNYEFLLRALTNACKIFTIPKIGYKHLVTREGSLFDVYLKNMPVEERKFWFDVANRESNFPNDRIIDTSQINKLVVEEK